MNRAILIVALMVAVCAAFAIGLRDPGEVVPAPVQGVAGATGKRPTVPAPSVPAPAGDLAPMRLAGAGDRNRPIEVLTAGFTSADSCTRCHEDQHRSWHASFHRTMTQRVSPLSMPADVERDKVNVAGAEYKFVRNGERYFVIFDDPVEPESVAVKKELVLVTGSHHMSVFWYESSFDRTPAMLPIVYLRDQQRWILRNAAFVRPPGPPAHELGRWNQVCSRCHSTHPRARLNTQTSEWDTHVVDFGVACEACHGPGEKHIQFHDNEARGVANINNADDVVVSPENLPHNLRSDVCGQCHSVHRPDFEAYPNEKLMQVGMPYRPGDDLEASPLKILLRSTPESEGTREFARAKEEPNMHNSFWPDGTVRVAGREYNGLIESACFQQGKMSCFSCHEMHPDKSVDLEIWRDDQLKPEMRTNHACVQCHPEPSYTTDLQQHTHHAADSHGSNCMNCHMPHSVYGLLKSVRSHRIEIPSAITTISTGRPNGCVLCHLDRNLGWAADHLTLWYGQPELELKSPIARETASGLVNLLLGDAGLRAIYASAFAWEPAREASGTDWMAPFLVISLLDDYDAIRVIAKRTLRTLPGYENVDIDEFAGIRQRAEAVSRFLKDFNRDAHLEPRPELLIDEAGRIDIEKASRMFNARDQTPIFIQE